VELDFPDLFVGRDEIQTFCLFVEQLDEAATLLKSGRLARQRMALVALDNLAETLLHDFAELSFFRSDEVAGVFPGPLFSQQRRRKIDFEFRRRVTLASQPQSGMGLHPQPILDDLDASILRVAHRYRNDVYHAGRHNPALIGPLAQLYAEAVGRSFIRSQEEGHLIGGLAKERLRDLDRFDWRRDQRNDRPRDTFIPRDAAQRIVSQILVFSPLVPSDLAMELVADIEDRCDALAQDLAGLKLPDKALESLFKSAQLWAAHRADEELIKLGEKHRNLLWDAVNEHKIDQATRAAIDAAKQAIDDRRDELIRKSVFPLKIEDIQAIREQAAAIRQIRAVASIVLRYQGLDEPLDQLELAIGWMVIDWSRYVELQDEIRRGK
jgi:hypothetical protein